MIHFKHRHAAGIILLATMISCFVAFYNNYPLVYQDTGSYIKSGFEGMVFYDRPIFYGLLIKWTSLSVSPWFVVFLQGLLVCYLIYKTLGLFFNGLKKDIVFIAGITFLTLTTGFSYNVSILIPDVFSAVTLLCLLNLLLNKTLIKTELALISTLFIFSISTQFSSIPIVALFFFFIGLVFIISKMRKRHFSLDLRRLGFSAGLFALSLFVIPGVHYLYDGHYKISGSNHVFIVNHFVDTGMLEDYLDETCGEKNYTLCAYKDSLGWDFMWSPESALQKTGGWEANRKEYKRLIKDVIFTPEYFARLALKSVEYSFKQFFTFQVSVAAPQLENTAPSREIAIHFRDSRREYISSLQNNSRLDLTFVNCLQQIVIITSMAFLFLVVLSPGLFKALSTELRWLVAMVLAHNLVSAFICSNLSTVHPRFQNRLAWLLPLCAGIIVLKWREARVNRSQTTGETT